MSAAHPEHAAVALAASVDEYYTEERCYILELYNTAADPAVSVARARVLPGVTTARHCVQGTTERYVLVAGRGRLCVDGLPEREVGPQDVVVIPPGVPQAIRNVGEADLVFLCICSPRFEWANYVALERG